MWPPDAGGENQRGIISGVPGHEIEDLTLRGICIQHRGGGTKEQAAIVSAENEIKYPEPNMFGNMPAQGMYLRHVKNVTLSDIKIAAMSDDARPTFIFQNVSGADLFHIKTPAEAPVLETRDSTDVQAIWVNGLKDGLVGK